MDWSGIQVNTDRFNLFQQQTQLFVLTVPQHFFLGGRCMDRTSLFFSPRGVPEGRRSCAKVRAFQHIDRTPLGAVHFSCSRLDGSQALILSTVI